MSNQENVSPIGSQPSDEAIEIQDAMFGALNELDRLEASSGVREALRRARGLHADQPKGGEPESQPSPGDRAIYILGRLYPEIAQALDKGDERPGVDEQLLSEVRAIVDLIGACDFYDARDDFVGPKTVHEASYLASRLLSVAIGDCPEPYWRKLDREGGSDD